MCHYHRRAAAAAAAVAHAGAATRQRQRQRRGGGRRARLLHSPRFLPRAPLRRMCEWVAHGPAGAWCRWGRRLGWAGRRRRLRRSTHSVSPSVVGRSRQPARVARLRRHQCPTTQAAKAHRSWWRWWASVAGPTTRWLFERAGRRPAARAPCRQHINTDSEPAAVVPAKLWHSSPATQDAPVGPPGWQE
eukprot:COSAG01_NODE_3244_length_6360_cov_4.915988_4_plen_189_part_00